MNSFARRFVATVLYFAALAAVGTAGYVYLEGWPAHDALYMTAITLTAVGYEEVHPLTTAGRNWTMFLLAGGITGMAVWFALLTALIVEFDLRNVFRRRRTMREIGKLQDHYIVCGAGRMGRQVVQEFRAAGVPYVVIERDEAQAAALYELDPGALVIVGDATDDHQLLQANIGRARGLVAALSADTDNLFVCLSARDLQPNLTIVARAYDETTMSKLYKAGADHVISPNISAGIRMASVLLRPSVVSFLDVAFRSPELALRLEEAEVTDGSAVAGKTLAEARIPQETGLIVIAVRKGGEEDERPFLFNPVATTRLDPGDVLIVLGDQERVRRLRRYLGG